MKKILLVITLALCLASCNDYLTLQPKNVITPQSVKDIKKMFGSDLKNIQLNKMNGYNVFVPTGYINNENFWQFEDQINFSQMYSVFRDAFEGGNFRWKSDSWEADIWSSLYKSIGNLNLYDYELRKLADNSIEAKEVKAEILFTRALYYFRLVQFFCPYRENQYSQDIQKFGLPILKKEEDLEDNYYPERLSQQETYAFIINDLLEVLSLDVSKSNWNLLYNKRASYGLLAEIYSWKAGSIAKESSDWLKARDYALLSIYGNSLESTSTEIESLFNAAAISKSPALIVVNDLLSYGDYAFYFNDALNKFTVNTSLYTLYDVADYRKSLFFDATGATLTKFNSADAAKKNITSYWRVSEMYLLIAESYIKLENDNVKALQYLNDFKKSRIAAYGSYAGTDILDEIIRERSKEFIGEPFYRWREMKRHGIVFSRITSKNETVTLEANDYRYSFKIPVIEELQQNPNNFQNPGWDSQKDENK